MPRWFLIGFGVYDPLGIVMAFTVKPLSGGILKLQQSAWLALSVLFVVRALCGWSGIWDRGLPERFFEPRTGGMKFEKDD